jgi:hypothetical protein
MLREPHLSRFRQLIVQGACVQVQGACVQDIHDCQLSAGFKYRLRFVAFDAERVAPILRQLPGARELTIPDHRFELRGEMSDKGMPDAVVRVDPALRRTRRRARF